MWYIRFHTHKVPGFGKMSLREAAVSIVRWDAKEWHRHTRCVSVGPGNVNQLVWRPSGSPLAHATLSGVLLKSLDVDPFEDGVDGRVQRAKVDIAGQVGKGGGGGEEKDSETG